MNSPTPKKSKTETTMAQAFTDFNADLCRHSLYKVNDLDLSQDLVQETYSKTLSYLARGGKIDVMKAFLYHALNCLIVDEYRRRKRKPSSLDSMLEKGFDPGFNDTDTLLDSLDGKTAYFLIKELPERYQKVLHMKYALGLSLQEISEITGQTRNAIAVQLHRAIERLRTLYNRT